MFNNLQKLSPVIWVLAILVIIGLPLLIIYIRKNFQISEITISAPWVKFSRKNRISTSIRHNLPNPDYGQFIGREIELAQIKSILRPYPHSQHAIVTIDGVGGIGKSALALEAAHRHLRTANHLHPTERFGAIVWISAKQTVLTASGIISRNQAFRNLDDIYAAISATLELGDISQLSVDERSALIRATLASRRILIIIDNLETVDDQSVINFLLELPAPSKAIVTTRNRIDVAYPIRLTGMDWNDAQILIAEECRKKSVDLIDEDARHLFDRTGGVPIALVWSIAQLSLGYTPETMLNRLGQPTGDIARFCFEKVVESIQGKPSYILLCVLSFFDEGTTRERLGFISNLPELDRDDGLVQLENLSLVNRDGGLFTMLPLTLEYVRAKLEKAPDLRDLLERRIHITPFKDMIPSPDQWWKKSSVFDLRAPVGRYSDGKVFDFVITTNNGSSTLLCGRTGSGKTNFLFTLIMSLAYNYSPQELRIWILKPEGMEYDFFQGLPHKYSIDAQLLDSDYHQIIEEIRKEIKERMGLLKQAGVLKFDDYRLLNTKPLPRLLIIIDEFQTLTYTPNVDLRELIGAMRISRSLGISFIFATQLPQTLSNEIRANMNTRVLFRCSESDARLLLDKDWEYATKLQLGEAIIQDFQDLKLIQIAQFQGLGQKDFYLEQLREFARLRDKG